MCKPIPHLDKDTASPTAFLHLYHILLRPAQATFHVSQRRRLKTTSSKLKTVNVTSMLLLVAFVPQSLMSTWCGVLSIVPVFNLCL